VTSSYALEEAQVNLDTREQRVRLAELVRKVRLIGRFTVQPLSESVVLPAKDRPILQAAIEAKATHLLTGDVADFGRYFGKKVEGVLILPPSDYLRSREDLEE